MSRHVRIGIFSVAACGLAGLLFWALTGVPDFGHYHWPYGRVLNHVAVGERAQPLDAAFLVCRI